MAVLPAILAAAWMLVASAPLLTAVARDPAALQYADPETAAKVMLWRGVNLAVRKGSERALRRAADVLSEGTLCRAVFFYFLPPRAPR